MISKKTKRQIRKNLEQSLDNIRQELGLVGMTLRNLVHLEGDTDYAEEVICEVLSDETDWDEWTDFDEVVNSPLFQRAVRYQAAFNTLGV